MALAEVDIFNYNWEKNNQERIFKFWKLKVMKKEEIKILTSSGMQGTNVPRVGWRMGQPTRLFCLQSSTIMTMKMLISCL